jgi:hypothetical protein
MVAFVITQGVTWAQKLRYRVKGGAGVNITGWTARAQARQGVDNAGTLFDITTPTGVSLTDPVNGYLQLNLTAVQTAALAAGAYTLAVHVTKPDGTVIELLEAPLRVKKSVVR